MADACYIHTISMLYPCCITGISPDLNYRMTGTIKSMDIYMEIVYERTKSLLSSFCVVLWTYFLLFNDVLQILASGPF